MHFRRGVIGIIVGLALISGVGVGGVAAQDADQDVNAAARAYQQGQAAQLAGDYARAAELFELAYAASPAAPAIRSAIRNRREAGQNARAATLAVEALQRFAADGPTRELAQEVLDSLQPTLGRLAVTCDAPCGVTLGGRATSTREETRHELFVDPGDHQIDATFGGRSAGAQPLSIEAGQSTELSFSAPPAEPEPEPQAVEPEPEPDAITPPDPPPPVEPEPEPEGMEPAVFYTGLAATAALGAVTIWSLTDTLDARDRYEADPTRERYDSGIDKQRRMYTLTALTAATGVATLLIGIFATDFGGGDDAGATATRLVPGFWAAPGTGGATVTQTF